jgi:hypothetical protein
MEEEREDLKYWAAYHTNEQPNFIRDNQDKIKSGWVFFTSNGIYIPKETPQEIKDIWKNHIECDVNFTCKNV